MKKIFLLFSVCAIMASCSSDDKPVVASSIALTESETTLYYDSEMPQLSVTFTPADTEDKAMIWTSSNSDVISVDNTGKLTLNKFAYGKVTITATNTASGKSASCDINLAIKKADINDFGVIDLTASMGFQMLDRNLGATKKYDDNASDADKAAAIGYYYQFGNSIPVGTSEGLNSYYDKESNGGNLDWTVAANTPCPEGWRIPNQEEMKKLADAAWEDWDGFIQSDEELDAACKFHAALLLGKGGYYKIDGATAAERAAATPELYLNTASFFWSSALNTTEGDATSERSFKNAYTFEDNLMVILGKKTEVNRAMPIRCIK